jgi:hypothetical protein
MAFMGLHFLPALVALPCGPWRRAPRTVLLLDSYGRNVAPISKLISVFRTELTARSPEPIDIQIISLELARFSQPEKTHLLVDFLRQRFAERQPALVVSAGGSAAGFVTEHRELLFPGAPTLVAGVAKQIAGNFPRLDHTLVAPLNIDLRSVIEGILQLLPRTRNVAVILGASPLERFWVDECRKAFAPFSPRVHFEYLDQLSFQEIQQRVAALPPDTAVFYALMIMDPAGMLFEPAEALKIVVEKASAPSSFCSKVFSVTGPWAADCCPSTRPAHRRRISPCSSSRARPQRASWSPPRS